MDEPYFYAIYKENYDRLNMMGRERANRTLIYFDKSISQ